jgi:hypothetical protein
MAVLVPFVQPVRIQFNEDKQQGGKKEKPRATITKKWQGNTYGGKNAYYHAYIYKIMHQQYGNDPIAVHSAKSVLLPFRKIYQPQ